MAAVKHPAARAGVSDAFKALLTRAGDTEYGQARVRVLLTFATVLYVGVANALGLIGQNASIASVLFFAAFQVWAIVLLVWIVRWPGNYPIRRAAAMAGDYSGLIFGMVVCGEGGVPLYAIVLWVTIGNGLRFGSRYLAVATGMALVSIAVTTWFTPYWRSEPMLVLMVVITTIIVPAYAATLLKRTSLASQAAADASLAKSQLLAQASHDLRQPVHAISLLTECLRETRLTRQQRELVGNVDRSLRSISRLFRSLLDVSALDSGKVEPQPRVIAAAVILDNLARINAEAARWSNNEIRVVRTSARILIDPDLLTTMLQNLLSNAFKYAPSAPILLGCRQRGGTLTIECHDRGPGIPDDQLGRLFEEFYRVEVKGRDVEGVGLGLSIVQRLGRLMKLGAGVRSREGRGTVAWIEGIPLSTSAALPWPEEAAERRSLLTGIRVLIVEDNEIVLAATADLLRKWGCVVEECRTVPQNPEPCDLIITDYDLNDGLNGGLNGADCIRQVRQRRNHHLPAIITTGHDPQRVEQEIADPSIVILPKPIRPAELRSAMIAQMV